MFKDIISRDNGCPWGRLAALNGETWIIARLLRVDDRRGL